VERVQYKLIRLLPVLFLASNSSLGVKTPFNRGNVYFSNGQTERILVP
jgi:hypothetical protein